MLRVVIENFVSTAFASPDVVVVPVGFAAENLVNIIKLENNLQVTHHCLNIRISKFEGN